MNSINPVAAACLTMFIASASVAQVVQLPSIHTFSYSGGALVPDQGTASLGGVTYASSGSNSRGWGPYGTRASGSMYGTSSATASVQIIDLRALDDAILSANVAKPTGAAQTSMKTPRGVVGNTSSEVGPNLDPGKWQRVLAGGHPTVPVHIQLAESDIRFYLRMGQEAEAANRVMASRVYYRMAIDAMTPEMQSRYKKAIADRETDDKAAGTDAKNVGRQKF